MRGARELAASIVFRRKKGMRRSNSPFFQIDLWDVAVRRAASGGREL
jgi:hypothetical protein